MTPISSIGTPFSLPPVIQTDAAKPAAIELGTSKPVQSFGQMIDGLVSSVDTQQAAASQITQNVLAGNSGQLHQSVIAMQEASISFSLMVEVRNKLVESYQELMRMQA
jgi:flagellar hook-basal body complex protein FliE